MSTLQILERPIRNGILIKMVLLIYCFLFWDLHILLVKSNEPLDLSIRPKTAESAEAYIEPLQQSITKVAITPIMKINPNRCLNYVSLSEPVLAHEENPEFMHLPLNASPVNDSVMEDIYVSSAPLISTVIVGPSHESAQVSTTPNDMTHNVHRTSFRGLYNVPYCFQFFEYCDLCDSPECLQFDPNVYVGPTHKSAYNEQTEPLTFSENEFKSGSVSAKSKKNSGPAKRRNHLRTSARSTQVLYESENKEDFPSGSPYSDEQIQKMYPMLASLLRPKILSEEVICDEPINLKITSRNSEINS